MKSTTVLGASIKALELDPPDPSLHKKKLQSKGKAGSNSQQGLRIAHRASPMNQSPNDALEAPVKPYPDG